MNDLTDKTMQTPIEVALGIDEEGMTTAKKLYDFLGMDSSNYSRWVRSNIANNPYAEENVDFKAFVINDENPILSGLGGRPTQDYKLTAHFAKKLSMMAKTDKGEQAREYFTRIEEKVKEKAVDLSELPPEMQMFKQIWDAHAKTLLEQKKQAERVDKLEKQQEFIKTAVIPVKDNWRQEVVQKFKRIVEARKCDYRDLWIEMYNELDKRAGTNTALRLENRRRRMKDDGKAESVIKKLNRLDIIEDDKKLREILSKILSEQVIRYC